MPFVLRAFGVPVLFQGDMAITGLSSRRAYLLLASLALDPKTSGTEKLALRLWPDAVNASGNLRSLLTSLKKKLGPDCFVQTRGTLRLAPGALVTDWELADAAERAAQGATDLAQKAAYLRDAARYFDGIFLETLDPAPEDDGWLGGKRAEAEARKAELGERLAHVLEETGDLRGAYEAASQALARDPERTDLQRMVLRLASGVKPRGTVRLLAKNLGLGELLPHLEQTRPTDAKLTLREEQALALALDAALSRLTRNQCLAAYKLSVFPQAFTAEQAEVIAGLEAPTREALLALCILRRAGERFVIPPDLRPLLDRKLTATQKERVHTRHYDYFLEYGAYVSLLDRKECHDGFAAEKANLLQIAAEMSTHSLTPRTLLFLDGIVGYLSLHDMPHCHLLLEQALPVLENALADPSSQMAEDILCQIAYFLIQIEADFEKGSEYLTRFAPYWKINSGPLLLAWLHVTHHRPDDAAFDTIYGAAETLLNTLDEMGRASMHCNMLSFLATRQTARTNYTEALEANTQALALIEEWEHLRDDRRWADYLEQRGGILQALGRRDEALAALDKALPTFKAQNATHRVADCYQQVGAILGEMGMNGLARERIEEAISLYESIPNPYSRAGALRTLGNVYKRMGERDTARALYEESLAVWKALPHPEWIARLEKCLAEIDK